MQTSFRQALPILCGVLLILAVLGYWLGLPEEVPNSTEYIKVAQGHADSVVKPFSARVLHPWLAGALMRMGWEAPSAFSAVAIVALAILSLGVAFTVRSYGDMCVLWPVLFFCPVLLHYFRAAYMNDLFHAALLSLLWVALMRFEPAVFPLVFALVLCRESSMLAGAAVIAYLASQKKFPQAAGVLAAMALGFVFLSHAVASGGHNRHDLSTGAYIALKTGWNFLANWMGLRLWRPTFEWSCPAPLYRNGSLVICDFHPEAIVTTWSNFVGILGLSFALLAASWRPLWKRRADPPVRLLLAITGYGIAAALAGTATGTATFRLIGYGWPLLLIVTPVLAGALKPQRIGALFLGLHLGIMWARTLVPDGSIAVQMAFCVAAIAANVAAYRWIRTNLARTGRTAELQGVLFSTRSLAM